MPRTAPFGAVILAATLARGAGAVEPPQAAAPLPPPIMAPQDKPRPGTIDLTVDATDLEHHVFAATEILPVAGPGKLTLLYPKWIPGTHSPTGPIAALAGLAITANGVPVSWQRDTVDPYAFHLTVPDNAATLRISLQYLSPPTPREGDVVMTGRIAITQWNQEILYPAGFYARDIEVHPHLVLPSGWRFGTALSVRNTSGDEVDFVAVPMDVLLDSPVYAGRNFARFDLAPGAKTQVHLDVVADEPEDLAISQEELRAHRSLVSQAERNFGSAHYDHFDFLLTLSDEITWRGLEHHRSSENGQDRDYFTTPGRVLVWRDLLPHEYTHSWDGKFRRPADLWSPDYTVVPERGSLLWVYEGQTEYWGQVLAARAGLTTAEQFRDSLAMIAAALQSSAGRDWRDLQDTTNDPVINERRPQAWPSWSLSENYYFEGLMIWLEADALIRAKTANAKSLTTFVRSFFGIDNGSFTEVTYTFDDIASALNTIYPYDWQGFFRTRLDRHPNPDLLAGLALAGWRLTYTETESPMQKSADEERKGRDFSASIGIFLGDNGTVQSVQWGGPAFHAGISRGVKLLAVNGLAVDSPATLADAITQAKSDRAPLRLLVRDGKYYRDVSLAYHAGLRYPHLDRIPGSPDRLSDIVSAQ